MIDIEEFSKETFKFAEEMGYVKDWSRGGCYIHLEASEFIEALRGKGNPIEELGDLLSTIFSVCENYNISVVDGIESARRKMDKIQKIQAFKNRGLKL
jgi:NTP pyrophosphatase (non-canonical NTP hydrolase)